MVRKGESKAVIDLESIKGFEKLGVNRDMFKEFLHNFYNAWGLEARSTIEPISVRFVKERTGDAYLRFDYKIYGEKCWMHVKGANTWY